MKQNETTRDPALLSKNVSRAENPTLPAIVATGDDKESLKAIRDLLASRLMSAPAREVAPIAKQLVEVIEKLKLLGEGKEVTFVDELREQRSKRLTRAN